MPMNEAPTTVDQQIRELKEELKTRVFDQGFHWKVLFLGRSINGSTDIVSSMSRSLRNLGHHVLDIDTAKHRITNNPSRATGGHGPIYVDFDKIESIVRNFQPQIIICCAGGLTFTEEHAAKLKALGIVLVGITLSDPDVFPSVAGHAHVFDFHTTNAALALEMYKGQGVNNTIYFPFGIDRGFVTQEVSDAPEFSADVICVGHANNRPDRNTAMTHLAKTLDVKVYGRGWELPESEVVSGDRALQALKMGKVHVNFPLTRAGYINIKCGVFESIGVGAIVATGRFEEMAHFFDYGEEILGYDDEADLERNIRELLNDPARAGRMRVAGFKRLINSHLYEHRWMSLFDEIRTASPDTAAWLSDERAAQIRTTLRKSLPRARKVILSGFYGANNLGDEMILRSISWHLRDADPSVQVYVGSERPIRVEHDHGLQSFQRSDHHGASEVLRTASAVVVGGGGLWHDYTIQKAGGIASLFVGAPMSIAGFGILPLMGNLLDIPFYTVGIGAGPLVDDDARRQVRYLASTARQLNVRDHDSRTILEGLGIEPDAISVSPDTVYAVDISATAEAAPEQLEALRAQGYRLIGLNLRHWRNAEQGAWLERLRKAINDIAASEKIAVVGLPMQLGGVHDEDILAKFGASLLQQIPFVALGGDFGLDDYLSALRVVDGVIAMRLHAALLAHRAGRPTVGLAYDPKVARHFDEVGAAELCLEITDPDADFLSAIRHMLALGGVPLLATQEKVSDLERHAAASLKAICAEIAASPDNANVYRIPSEKPTYLSESASKKNVPPAATATFEPMVGRANKFRNIPERRLNVLFDSPRAIHVSLPTAKPWRGQTVEQHGHIRIKANGPVEIALQVENRYQNPKALGNIAYFIRIGNSVLREDLCGSKDTIHVRYLTAGESRVPFSVAVVVLNNCREAEGWRRFSKVSVRISHVHAVAEQKEALMFASGRSILALDDAARSEGGDHLMAESASPAEGALGPAIV
ncbi:polysaccharide pyruvyl transferase CsaB [Arthrobacter pascens]|uniref:polysaccharide pyruvyl transferase family protein n=1 Tax=Arthrobacter pascens TaxID=1677 RepID=UPI00278EC39C|nr:polysaccharide pyruvyl transferase family protein [Arthrobacter pascens]MDQ0677967.1 polysaccharide pyruvyl transferase CsaB [Arthrobacter pascens]